MHDQPAPGVLDEGRVPLQPEQQGVVVIAELVDHLPLDVPVAVQRLLIEVMQTDCPDRRPTVLFRAELLAAAHGLTRASLTGQSGEEMRWLRGFASIADRWARRSPPPSRGPRVNGGRLRSS
ncbi:hypothetical protein AB0L34_15795 [Micromonospora sp. NPDC052213]|uniref:hypothetical protein n=1 Tax=Micromonospora sp. NPDC052213 TaxID=3155812 RepID=UPI003424D350